MFKWGFAACVALVVTVNAAPVEQLWERRYNGQASREDVFSALTVDVGGRVYVTGSSDNNVNPDPYGTVKYDTNGTRLWEARYTGPRAIDVPLSVVVDGQGYVYVTGFSHGFASGYDPDYATIKYAPEGTELWVARYNGAGTNYQSPDNPMAMLVNAAGEVYVTGTSMSPQQTLDFATIKYATNGTELWIARYDGSAGYSDRATAMGMDGAGNIYVCGASDSQTYGARVTLLKYSPTGTLLWERHFETSEEGYELVPQMKVDPSGKAHIAFTTRRGSQQDVRRLIALQYNSEGELVWRTHHRLFNSQYGIDVVAVDLDDAGNMCAAVRGVGSSYYDYLVWKVSAAGQSLWTSRYNSPSGYQDVLGGMALDAEGNIYVTGTAYTSGNHYQLTTIKLRANGQREWETTTAHSDNFGMSLSGVRVDPAGHVYVGGSVGPIGAKDYVTIKYRQLPQPGLPEITAHPVAQSTLEGGSAAFSVTATGEGLEYQWRRDGFPIPDATNSTLILTNIGGGVRGYYYVEVSNSGGTVASTEALLDVILAPQIVEQPVSQQVIAGAAAGFSVMVTGSEPLSFQWSRGGTAIAGATNSTLVISNVQPADAASYSVVVTNIAGSTTSESATLSLVPGLEQLFVGTFRQPGQGYGFPQFLRVGTDGKAHLAQMLQLANQADFLTVQFDTNGVPTWSARYALGTNRANYLSTAEMDRSNNVYVAGTGGENLSRWLAVVKYGPAGNQLWSAAHDTARTNTYDSVAGMAVDAAGNVYVTGGTESEQIHRDFLTVKFDANGVEQWAVRYSQTDSSSEAASAIQVDASGVYVFGLSYHETPRLVTIKYDHAGTLLWTRIYDCGNSGQAAAMKLDAAGNVIVTGSAAQPDSDSDFVTLKYSPGGDVLWIAQFTGMTDAYDYPYAMDLDAAGNVYVAGRSSLPNEENTGLSAFSIVKYNASGTQLWVSSEIAAASEGGVDSFAVDAAGSAYRVLGKYHEESGSDFVTAKFDANGTRLWEAISTRGKYSDEYAGALALTDGGDLLVSGISYNPVSELLLFRYRQSEIVGLPVITEPPRSRDVIVGASATFSVTATGTGLSYQWYFNGRPIGGATSPSYTVTSAGQRNEGFYAVEVRNAVGSVLSPTAILSIGVPPVIAQQPSSQTVLPGADLVFEVFADGSRPLSFQWRHNGTNIPGAFGARLELLNVQLEHGGLYSVVVSNRAGVVTSANALLTVTRQARREWLSLFTPGVPSSSFPEDMELDGAENIYVAGNWAGTPPPSGYLTAKFNPAGEQLWAQKFVLNGPDSYAAAVAVDLAGNVYVVGESVVSNSTLRGVVTVKYDANGNQLWARELARPNQTPLGQDITLSLSGNIYVVASFGPSLGTEGSLVTVGYDTNGVQLWSAIQSVSPNDTRTCKVAAHSDAEVYTVGHTWDQSIGRDVIAIRYNAAGTQVWNRRLADAGDQRLVDLKIDAAGDPVVVAHSIGNTNHGFLTVKFRSTDGEVQWKRSFSLSEYGNDEPFALEVDYTRNIYVTGKAFIRSYNDENGNYHQDEDVLTLKYSPTGELLWVATYGAPTGDRDIGRSIAWDGFAGLYITGTASGQYGNEGWLTLRYDTDGNRYWSDIYNGPYGGRDYGVAVRARGTNAYVVGLTTSDGYERVGLIKYTDVGTADVPRITTAPQSQTAIAGNNVTLSVVASGTGPLRYQWYHNGSPISGATGASVLLPQVETTNAGNYSVEISNAGGVVVSPNALLNIVIPARIVVGPEDQCVVAGSHVQFRAQVEGDGDVWINWYHNGALIPANYYYLTITNATAANAGLYTVVVTNMYGSATASARLTISPQAALAWSSRYNYTNSSYDIPEAAVVDAQGSTYILGNSARGSVLLKYESTGALAWERWNVRTSYIMFAATELALGDGAVYIAGWVQGPMENEHLLTLTKYSSNGAELWAAEYSAIGDFPRPVDMKVDAAGNVCITAETGPDRYTPAEILTLKYDSDGNRLWVRRLDYGDAQDLPVALAVDPAGNVYVTGYSVEPNGIEYAPVANYLTVKYDAAGTQLWTAEHIGPGSADDRPSAIAVDAQGNVYVTGRHSAEYWVNSGTTVYFDYDYATIKYNTDGQQLWLAVYNSAPRQPDEAVDLKVDAAGNVYVVGQSDGDIVTVKYNAAGEQQWVTGFDSGFDYDVASRLVLDNLGNAYVTGHSGDYGDIITCKLDANGSRIWVARFDGRQPAHGSEGSFDYPIGIGLDAARNVYVAGSVSSPVTSRDFIVFRYTVTSSPGSPVITVPPQDTTANFGATAMFSVTATGDAPLRYQWRRNGIALANETNATLQIPEVTFADAAQYSVVVHNNIDFTVSAGAALTVVMPEMVQCVHLEQTGNGVRLIVAGPAACTYRVECTADFVAWEALGTVYNHSGTCEYLDTTPAGQRRFYRVVKLPH